jgi:hypothetical protein
VVFTTQTINKNANTYEITGLQKNITYTISLTATSGSNVSLPSTGIQYTTLAYIIYSNITFPDTYATFTQSSTYSSDIFTNTYKSLDISGGTVYKNGTYTVSSSSAYASNLHPYFAFCNANTPSGVTLWSSGGTATTTPAGSRTITTSGYQVYNQTGYSNSGVYQGATGAIFTTSYTESGVSKTMNGEWIQIQFPYYLKLTQFSFYPKGGDYMLRDKNPKTGVILGSTNGTTWFLIHNYVSGTLTGNTGPFTYSVNTTTAYNYIRFVVNSCYGTTEGNFLSITKIYYTGDIYYYDIGTTVSHSANGKVIPNTYTSGNVSYTYYVLDNTSGSYTFIPGTDLSSVQLLMIGGGGGAASTMGGGGGAGGLLFYPTYSVTQLINYNSITIGAGAPRILSNISSTYLLGSRGSNTVFNSIVANGGGGGSMDNYLNNYPSSAQMNGGSGGGRGGGSSGFRSLGPGTGTSGQGTNGQVHGSSTVLYNGGGGGGSSSMGDLSGNGGDGTLCSITGKSIYYAGGGAGSSMSSIGGLGGGGASMGGFVTIFNLDGLDGINYGSGGGSSFESGIAFYGYCGGGSQGVVIIAFKTLLSNIVYSPTGLTVTNYTTSTISFSFTPPSGTVYYYLITVTSASGNIITKSIDSPATSYTITGLDPGITYTIKIATVNLYGRSLDSTSIITQTTQIPYAITYPETYTSFRYFNPNPTYTLQNIDISGGFAYKNGRYTTSTSGVNTTSPANRIPSNAFNIIDPSGSWFGVSNVYGPKYTGTTSTPYNGTLTASGEWLQIQLPYQMKLTSYTMHSMNNGIIWRGLLLGSTNGSTWTLIKNHLVYSLLDTQTSS